MDQADQSKNIICPICEVSEGISKHHVLPKSRGGKEVVSICQECHKQIHTTFTNKQLEKNYASVEALKSHEEIKRWIVWRQKHPNASVNHKQTKNRKRFSKFS